MKPQRIPTKIINDPVHGFIEIPKGLLLDLIDHPAVQRLRHIKQLGLSYLVYPGAVHTRFNHALGAMHLTRQALALLRRKGVEISDEELEATSIAILLHDIGHGPFSHALEQSLIPGLDHEDMSLALMRRLDTDFDGALQLGIEIFKGDYSRGFFHQLVSSQLDMDRMDYLIRDSFFTGVAEGVVGIDRIIKTLNVLDDVLVCEEKGIYSVEKFVVARRLMYWQVYLHRAALAAERMLVNILRRARELFVAEYPIDVDDNLAFFFSEANAMHGLNDEVTSRYILLDDTDIEFALKKWIHSDDPVLSRLCQGLNRRHLLKIRLENAPFPEATARELQERYAEMVGISAEEARYFVFCGNVSNQAYLDSGTTPIMIQKKNGKLTDLGAASDLQAVKALSGPVTKHYLCYPAEIAGFVPESGS